MRMGAWSMACVLLQRIEYYIYIYQVFHLHVVHVHFYMYMYMNFEQEAVIHVYMYLSVCYTILAVVITLHPGAVLCLPVLVCFVPLLLQCVAVKQYCKCL